MAKNIYSFLLLFTSVAFSSFSPTQEALATEEIIVYSARNEQLIKPLFDAYEEKNDVKIKYLTDKAGPLLQKLKAEGKNSPADMLVTVDAGNLWFAAKEDLLKEINSKSLKQNIPNHLRDPKNQWFGLSIRARTIFYNPKSVKASELSTYEDLADPKWQGRLCLRTSKKVYNQSLVAMMIAEMGEKETEKVIEGWVNNLAAVPFSSDSKMLAAIDSGQCQVGIANTYYFGRIQKKNPETNIAIFWPNQKTTGVHINIAGAGLTKYGKNPKAAQKLLEWLTTEEAQNLFADGNMEYPVNPKVKPVKAVADWGEFKAADLNVSKAGELQVEAVKLMDRAAYK